VMSSTTFAPGRNPVTQPRLRARRTRVPAAIAGATPPAPPLGLGIRDRPFLGLPRRRAARHVRVERCAKCDALGKSLGANMRECCRRAAGLADEPSRARVALGAAAVGGVATAAYVAYGGSGGGRGGGLGGRGFGGGGNGGGAAATAARLRVAPPTRPAAPPATARRVRSGWWRRLCFWMSAACTAAGARRT
jgi:hypothetical protein